MSSTFAWLDHDEGERRRMMEVIDLFRERGTLDELGIGTIRDTLAERFFPGLSTIQTRARYFLFVPWLYLQLERERIPAARAWVHIRWLQARLVESLKRGGEGSNAGLIGIDAGADLQRPPSIVYWAGLKRFGILHHSGSVESYHRSLDEPDRSQRRPLRGENEELLEQARHTWHPSLPAAPDDLFEATTFRLRHDESEFLGERIRLHAPDSLLAACLTPTIGGVRRAQMAWHLRGIESLDPTLRADIEHARLFALLMDGAVRTYNVAMAEAAEARGIRAVDSLTARMRSELSAWTDEMRAEEPAIRTWDRLAFWSRLYTLNPRIPARARRFADIWMDAATEDPTGAIDDPTMRLAIARREHELKGSLARLHNERALERWSGSSGLGRLSYRWNPVARQIVLDILDGRGRPVDDA